MKPQRNLTITFHLARNNMTDKKIKVEFAPGAFDSFEGTQEELDELVAEIHRMIQSGEMLEKAQALDFDELMEEDPEMAMTLARQIMASDEDDDDHRNLQ